MPQAGGRWRATEAVAASRRLPSGARLRGFLRKLALSTGLKHAKKARKRADPLRLRSSAPQKRATDGPSAASRTPSSLRDGFLVARVKPGMGVGVKAHPRVSPGLRGLDPLHHWNKSR